MDAPKSFLVPVDFSPSSEAAVDHALTLMRAFSAKLELLHVWTTPAYASPDLLVSPAPAAQGRSLLELMHAEAERRMEELLRRVHQAELVKVAAVVRSGEPASAILEHEQRHDGIVMGTHGRGGLEHLVLGSITERVARHAQRPLLIVRAGTAPVKPKRILVLVDFSNHARLALEWAAKLAKGYGAEIELLHVVGKIPALAGLEKLIVTFKGDPPDSYETFALEHAKKEMALFLERTPGHEIARIHVRHGDAVETILSAASEGDFDRIVIGRQGRTVFGLELGGTAVKVLRATPIPTWIVHDETPIEKLGDDFERTLGGARCSPPAR